MTKRYTAMHSLTVAFKVCAFLEDVLLFGLNTSAYLRSTCEGQVHACMYS